jgi:predicted anti-sigma-YlaC factor YlaD
MNFLSLFFDIAPLSGGAGAVGIFLAIAFGFIVLAAAFFAFVMLRKTLKMAFRLLIVAVLALIALVGSVSFLLFSSGSSSPKSRPANSRPR